MKTNLITQYFEVDHKRLDAAFACFQALKRESFPEAKQYFKIFYKGLKRHIVWEEEVLFPLFEEKSGMKNNGPTFVMRDEHRRIGAFLDRIHEKVRKADPLIDDDERVLLEVLGAHNTKEEQVLYPAIDKLVDQREMVKVFLALENIPAERYETCCGVQK